MDAKQQYFITHYQSMFRRLSWMAWKRIGIYQDAQDIAAVALTKTYDRLKEIECVGMIYSFATTCARNGCTDYLRTKKHFLPVPEIEEQQMEEDTETLEVLYQAIKKLPRRKRTMIFHYLNALTIDEIAHEMNSTNLTIRQDKLRAIKFLRKELTDKLFKDEKK